jgi:hypothetical protein
MDKLWPMFVVLVATWHYLLSTQFVLAHDWYGSTSDPVYQSNCCGGHDCAPVDPAWVSEVSEGYRLTMTADQARTVNPSAAFPVDAVIPWSRIQSPPKAEHEFMLVSMTEIAPRRAMA